MFDCSSYKFEIALAFILKQFLASVVHLENVGGRWDRKRWNTLKSFESIINHFELNSLSQIRFEWILYFLGQVLDLNPFWFTCRIPQVFFRTFVYSFSRTRWCTFRKTSSSCSCSTALSFPNWLHVNAQNQPNTIPRNCRNLLIRKIRKDIFKVFQKDKQIWKYVCFRLSNLRKYNATKTTFTITTFNSGYKICWTLW